MVLFYVVAALIATVLAPTGFRFFTVVGSLVSLRFVHLLGQIALDAAPERWKHRARLPLARLGIALPLVVAGCGEALVPTETCDAGHDAAVEDAPSDAPSTCATKACPAGVFDQCPTSTSASLCCLGGADIVVCSMPAGILSRECPMACPQGSVCAISTLGSITCCDFTQAENPCSVPVL